MPVVANRVCVATPCSERLWGWEGGEAKGSGSVLSAASPLLESFPATGNRSSTGEAAGH